MPKKAKTNAMRMLEAKGIAYETHTFSPDIRSAEGVAEAVGWPADQVFKTLVVRPANVKERPLLAVIPGNCELDLRQLAKAMGIKKLRMATQREAESLTGLLVGGISALALLSKGFKVFLDASANEHERILVSAGQRGINLELGVEDFVAITRARLHSISHKATNRADIAY